jgi:hypothetical protein
MKSLSILVILAILLAGLVHLGTGAMNVPITASSIPDNAVTSSVNKINDSQVREPILSQTEACDLLITGIWLEDSSTVCYEITNQGTVESPPTITEIELYLGSCGGYETIYQDEASLRSGSNRTVCLDVFSILENWCTCKTLTVRVEADYSAVVDVDSPDQVSNNVLTATFDNLCADGIQNYGEYSVDCGGPCPASCRDCFEDADFGDTEDADYFCLDSDVILYTARLALQEYANCLRNPDCRDTLRVTDPLLDFSKVTTADLAQNTDYIMEAVAYYVYRHVTYMIDGSADIYDESGVINAVDMVLQSGNMSGVINGYQRIDTCPNDYCGDCEDQAVLREALMRSLGVSWRCAFCADHYNSYFGGGHTFNLVYYRNKWRIMDYGPLGSYFSINNYRNAHNPHNVWNDRVGEYWCPYRTADPACWFCCNTDPYSWTQNYNVGDVCGERWRTYYEECAP